MTYDLMEKSQYSGKPYEMYLFSTEEENYYLTSADEPKIYQGAPYIPTAIVHTEPSQGMELKSGVIKVVLPHDHAVASLFYAYNPISPLWLTIYRAHEGEDPSETVTYWTGKVASARFGEVCELECTPEHEALRRKIPSARHQLQCNLILYSARCGVNPALWKVDATITAIDGKDVTAVAFGSKPDGWFRLGYVEKAGQRRMIASHAGNVVTLVLPFPVLQVNDVVTAYAGCDRYFTGDCVTKFDNGVHYIGFPWLPTKNPFNGGIAY